MTASVTHIKAEERAVRQVTETRQRHCYQAYFDAFVSVVGEYNLA